MARPRYTSFAPPRRGKNLTTCWHGGGGGQIQTNQYIFTVSTIRASGIVLRAIPYAILTCPFPF